LNGVTASVVAAAALRHTFSHLWFLQEEFAKAQLAAKERADGGGGGNGMFILCVLVLLIAMAYVSFCAFLPVLFCLQSPSAL
jgi:hypothetical protein